MKLSQVLALEREQSFSDGEFVMREGERGHEMYVIRSGEILITKMMGGRERVLTKLGKGEFFGEMSLLESLPREADARALGPTTVLVVNAGGLLQRIRLDPTFALEMLHHLSGRLRASNSELATLLAENGGQ